MGIDAHGGGNEEFEFALEGQLHGKQRGERKTRASQSLECLPVSCFALTFKLTYVRQ
jgi:hypothetical protein